jgi:hypothetical protein
MKAIVPPEGVVSEALLLRIEGWRVDAAISVHSTFCAPAEVFDPSLFKLKNKKNCNLMSFEFFCLSLNFSKLNINPMLATS